ncbi:hypothetical protein Tco_0267795 [Tanacetum coccineum]
MPKDSSNSDEVLQNVTFEIHHGGCFTATPSKSYISGQVLSVSVVDIDEFYLHDLKDMVVKLGYGVADLMYFHFLRPILGLDYGLHPLNVNVDLLEMEKYVKDYKIIFVYVEHGSSNVDTSIFVTPKKGVAIAVDNHLRKGPIEIDSNPDVNRNLTPMLEGVDPLKDLDVILGDYANTRDEITRKQMVVHVGNSSTVDDVLNLQMLFETEKVGHIGKFKEVEHDKVFDDYEHIVEDVHVSMNNFNFNVDPRHDLSIAVVEVYEHDLDVIDYDSFNSDLDDGINSERRSQLKVLRRISKAKNQGPNKLRVRCEGTIPALVPYVANDIDINKNVFSQIKSSPVVRENNISGKQNILDKDKIVQGKDGRAVQDQMQKQFDVGVSKMKAFRVNRIASDKLTGTLKQGFRACGKEILRLDGCFMPGPWPGQILTSVGVDANNRIYPVAYAIVEAESKAKGLIQAIASVFPSAEHRYYVRHIHENMKSRFKGGVYKEMLWNAAKATPVGEFNQKMSELKSFNSTAYDWLMKISAEQWTRSYFSGRAKCDLLLNNIYEVFNRQLVDGKDQPIINCLEYIRVPPKKRKKSYDEIASQSASSGKLSRKGKQAAGARNASSQTAGASQPSAAPNTASQGPTQHSAGPS